MLKNDLWINQMAAKGMICPFEPSLIRKYQTDPASPLHPVISYGLSSYGYDIRYVLLSINNKQQQQRGIFVSSCNVMFIQT